MATLRYAPHFELHINGEPVPAALRNHVMNVRCQAGLEGADRLDLTLANENLRWLDHALLRLDNAVELRIGYTPDPLQQVFSGEIVSQDATFPASGMPTLSIAAQSRMQRLQQGGKARWFAVPLPMTGNMAIPDPLVSGAVSIEHGLIPILDPVGAAIAVLLGGVEMVTAIGNPDAMQKVIRKQHGESDFDFLRRIATENGWEMMIDHGGSFPGYQLRFFSPLDHLDPGAELTYGKSLIDFTPRISKVGQVASVSVSVWVPQIKTSFAITVSYDWDRQSLNLGISSGGAMPVSQDDTKSDRSFALVDEPLTPASAPRVIISKLIPRLNQRLTGSGSTIGDLRIIPGGVVKLLGLGEQFSGLYRVTSVTHNIDSGGFRTSFEVRKEIWFGSIPLPQQGAVPIRLEGINA